MIRVVAAVIERDGRILICRRRTGGLLGGKWEFPGGKMRPSETPRRALERELREELGVAPGIRDPLRIVRHRYEEIAEPVHISFFDALLAEPPRNLAFETIVWARREQLLHYDFLAADRRLVSLLARGDI